MKRLALLSLVFMSYSVLAAPVLRFKCGDDKFVMYVNASMSKQAVIMNDQLTENSATDQYPYGDLGDSVVITFDVWGRMVGCITTTQLFSLTIQKLLNK